MSTTPSIQAEENSDGIITIKLPVEQFWIFTNLCKWNIDNIEKELFHTKQLLKNFQESIAKNQVSQNNPS